MLNCKIAGKTKVEIILEYGCPSFLPSKSLHSFQLSILVLVDFTFPLRKKNRNIIQIKHENIKYFNTDNLVSFSRVKSRDFKLLSVRVKKHILHIYDAKNSHHTAFTASEFFSPSKKLFTVLKL